MTVATKITQTFKTLKLKMQGLWVAEDIDELKVRHEVTCRLYDLEDLASEGWNISLKLDDGFVFSTDDLHSESIDDSYHWIVDGDNKYRQWKIGSLNRYITDMTQVIALVETNMVRA